MSKGIRYDSLLVRHLAEELDARVSGRSIRRVHLDVEHRAATLELESESLRWELHPERGWLTAAPPPPSETVIDFRRGTIVTRIQAPADERLIRVTVAGPARSVTTIIFELMTNQWNALVLDEAERIGTLLWRRETGRRSLRPGETYAAPKAHPRAGTESPLTLDEWLALLSDLAPAERARRLIDRVAFASPLNVGWMLGEAANGREPAALDAAHTRYVALVPPAEPRPVALPGTPRQPYPYPVDAAATPCDGLLGAMEIAATTAGATSDSGAADARWIDRIRHRARRSQRRVRRLEEELAGAGPEAARLRRSADLLLAQARSVEKGTARARLSDFAGGEIEVELDPALSAVENAQRIYRYAKRRERAAERIPALLRDAEAERDRLDSALERAALGELSADEIRAIAGEQRAETRRGAPHPSLPYRRYRTSGGLEVRVGRDRASNDELTFHHSAPEDIWMHARDVAGSHVVLRWGRRDTNPPARDLAEAAVLAALRSRARTSGTVAVDWTRRKYVRKPRKAPPGRVAVERAATLFVEPDPALEQRLRYRRDADAT